MSKTPNPAAINVTAATMAELVAFYNEHSGRPAIKKFETRQKGMDRVTALIATFPAKPTALSAMARTLVAQPAKPAPAPARKAPAPRAEGSTVRGLFGEDWVITVVHQGANPKKSTAAERFNLYRSGMTVAEYIAAGGQRRDVVWDSEHKGWVRVDAPKAGK